MIKNTWGHPAVVVSRRQGFFLCFWTCFILCLGLAGCATRRMAIVDPFPGNVPKGYIDFLVPGSQSVGGWELPPIGVYMVDGGEQFKVGSIIRSSPFSYRAGYGLRIALEPGTYHFILQFGQAKTEVRANVVEGMITPVNITFDVGEARAWAGRIHFRMGAHVESELVPAQ